jgi:hypothetical protein
MIPVYKVCSKECQKKDWKRHRREDCFIIPMEEGLPKKPCDCQRCLAGKTDMGDDKVSTFFQDLHFIRGKTKLYKVTPDGQAMTLSQKELDQIAYPYARFVYMGAAGIFVLPKPKTFYAANPEKGFTVRELAQAIAQAEKENQSKHHEIAAVGGGYYYEGFVRHKDPHTFYSIWGTSMLSDRKQVLISLGL